MYSVAFGSAVTSPASAGEVESLDPATYEEPNDAEYWGGFDLPVAPPYDARRYAQADLTKADFRKLIEDGRIFVVTDVGQEWPMQNWTCDFFSRDPTFQKAEMAQQYAEGGASPFVGFASNWADTRTPSGAADPEAPQVAPFYWGIKDLQYEDAHRSKTWKKNMLKKVQESVRLPPFMDEENLGSFRRTPEFWFAVSGAGAKAHMDTHVQATISLQLAGTKRWRLRSLDKRRAPFLAMIYQDGDPYKHLERWVPHFNITLRPGEALFFPPGTVHETLTLDIDADGSKRAPSDACAASVTFQFDTPMAARFYRRFFPRVRRTADIHESWQLIATWATLQPLRESVQSGEEAGRLARGAMYAEARELAIRPGNAFDKADGDRDKRLTEKELLGVLGPSDVASAFGWHDLDEDGMISREEYQEGFAFWSATTFEVMKETPKKWRKYQVADSLGEMNIEDLEGTRKMRSWGERREAELAGSQMKTKMSESNVGEMTEKAGENLAKNTKEL